MTVDIHSIRKELGLTLEEIANFVGVTKSTVKKWESGNIKNMKRDKIMLLAEILNVPPLAFIVAGETSGSDSLCSSNEVFFRRNSQLVCESFSNEDFDFLMKTIDLIKRNK